MADSADASAGSDRAERLTAIYTDNYALLSALASRRFRIPDEDVRNLVHEVFVSFIRHEPKIRDVRAWLIGAVWQASRRYRDKAAREEIADLSELVDPSPLPEILNARADVALAFRHLGDRCREVIRLRFLEGLDFDELGALFSITPGSAKLRLARCMKTAREALRALRARGRT
jgi:RNA polymerase sigma factor (sigma-70 family)